MTSSGRYEIEPELLRTPPRPMKRKAGRKSQSPVIALVMLPILCLALFFLRQAALYDLVANFGQVVAARVTKHEQRSGSKSGSHFYLFYDYKIGATSHSDSSEVWFGTYHDTRNGAPVEVKVMPSHPELGSMLVDSLGQESHNWFAVLIPLSMVALLCLGLVQPRIRRALIARGVPVAGRIVDKQKMDDPKQNAKKTTSYFLQYEYAPIQNSGAWSADNPLTSPPLKGMIDVQQSDWESVQKGDAVTVLYDARRPTRSLLYRFADFEVT